MSRQNVNTDFKFGNSDAFMLTDIDTNESVMLITSDTAGNFAWTGVTRAPLVRNAMQTSNTSNQYSDLERPWISIPQEDWTGGRGNDIFTKDTTRYRDGKRAQAAFNQVIYNGPLDYYSTGFRKAETNCPGSMSWKQMAADAEKYVAVEIIPAETFVANEIYIHLRKRGVPRSALVVDLLDDTAETVLATHAYTNEEITDTLSEFAKFTFEPVQLEAGETYYIRVHSDTGSNQDHWEVGIKTDYKPNTYYSANGVTYYPASYELYYRISEEQVGYKTLFFTYEQLPFMIRQKIGETPTLWLNGDIGKATSATELTITDSSKSWKANAYKGARIGLIYRNGSEEYASVWRTILSNTTNSITVNQAFDITPSANCIYIINDTPLWQKITGHGLTAFVTDIHVIRGVVYFCQGDYTDARKMRWHDGVFQWKQMTSIKASFFQSVRDSSCMMLYCARNDDKYHNRSVSRSILLDWEDTATAWTKITNAITTKEPDTEKEIETITTKKTGDTSTTITQETKKGINSETPTIRLTVDTTSTTSTSGNVTTVTQTSTKETKNNLDTPLRTSIVTESKNFQECDYDSKQYVITIDNFESENNTGRCVITLQESNDNKAFTDVQTVTAYGTGKWYIYAHCQYQYRRFAITATGTKCTVNNISITTSDIPQFVDRVTLLDNYGKITRLFEYGAEQYKSLWIAQEGMLSSINKVDNTVDTYTLDRINMDELQTTAEEWNAKSMNTSDVYLLWGWLNGLQRYYNTQLEGKGPDHDEGLPFDRQGRVTQIVSYPSNFFISIDAEDGYSCVMQFNQSGWHEIYRAPNKGERIYDMAFQPIYGTRPDRLWLNVGDDVIWLAMPSKILYAIQDQHAEYTHESVLISSWHTAGMMDIEKLWQTLKIMADYLDGKNCWIEADYQTDEEETWHPIKNWYTISPSQKEDLNPSGSVNGKKLRYRLRLQSTDMYKTPKVNVVVLEAVGRVDIKMSYNFSFRNIKYKRDLNAEFEDIEPLEVQNILDEWANDLKKLRMNSRWKIFDDKLVYLDAVQTSVLNELSEGYIGQITLNEL